MAELVLRFEVPLQRHDLPKWKASEGPIFVDWAPNREDDVIALDTGQPDIELKVWFDGTHRLSLLGRNFGEEVDAEEVDNFGYLASGELTALAMDGGPLRGRLTMANVPDEVLAVLREQKIGSRTYVTFGEQVVDMIVPSVSRLIDLLRTHYGQYWLRSLLRWEGTDYPDLANYERDVNDCMRCHEVTGESLGEYCSDWLCLEYTLDEGATWSPFRPTASSFIRPYYYDYDSRSIPIRTTDYLSPEDLKKLGDWVRRGHEPSPAARAIALTKELHDQEDWAAALIMSVTAFEVAWGEFRKSLDSKDQQTQEKVNQFMEPYKDRRRRPPVKLLMRFIFDLKGDQVPWQEYTISDPLGMMMSAIKLRNDVVHKGMVATMDTGAGIWCLIALAATLLIGPRYRPVRPLRFPLTYARS